MLQKLSVIAKIPNISKKLAIVGSLFILAAVFFLFGGLQVSNLERMKIEDASNSYLSYFEEIQNNRGNGLDQYIVYALTYSYNEKNDSSLTSLEIQKMIKDIFNVKLSEDKVQKNGISPLLLEKHVAYDQKSDTYTLDTNVFSQSDLAEIPIYKYRIQSIKKKSGSRYVVQYKKYVVENPYDILNYYGNSVGGGTSNRVDTTKILNYLTAKGKIIDIKLACNDEILEKYGKDEGNVTIVYRIHNDQLQIINLK